MLSVIIQKIITNLKFWGASETIITKTLQLLNDLSVGYSSVRKLIKLDAVQFMLNHHTSDNFPFLGFTPSPGTVMLQVRHSTLYVMRSSLQTVSSFRVFHVRSSETG